MFLRRAVKPLMLVTLVCCFFSLSFGADTTNTAKKAAPLQLTIADLAKYNGKNGNPAYVVIDSIIYDVTKVSSWKNGEHKMGLKAGTDLSDKIAKAPHGKKVMTKMPVVGKLIPTLAPAPAATAAPAPATN
jgi:predicted heme/steroid binding protein